MGPTKSFKSDVQIAWVAGLIEGEGWFGTRGGGRPTVEVASTDRDVIDRLRAWTGVGTIDGPYVRPNRKPYFKWRVTAREDAAALLLELCPYLCERRLRRAREVLAIWETLAPKLGTAPACKYGHLLSGGNLYIWGDRRRCRECQNRRQREYGARQRANVGALSSG